MNTKPCVGEVKEVGEDHYPAPGQFTKIKAEICEVDSVGYREGFTKNQCTSKVSKNWPDPEANMT